MSLPLFFLQDILLKKYAVIPSRINNHKPQRYLISSYMISPEWGLFAEVVPNYRTAV